MYSIMDEILGEATLPCRRTNCSCSQCTSERWNKNKALIKELGWELTAEEEYELSKAFDKIKNFAKRTYQKAKPLIVTADIIRRIIFPSTDPVPQLKDVATYVEQDKKRRMQDRIEQAQQSSKTGVKQRPPDGETTLIDEILMEGQSGRYFSPSYNYEADHTKGARPSTKGKHEKGQTRKIVDRGGEKGDVRRPPPRKRPPNWRGPWPPLTNNE